MDALTPPCRCGCYSSSDKICDIVLANGYTGLFASSSLARSYANNAQNGQVYFDATESEGGSIYPSAPFESTGKLEYENGPWHDNICVGQYGVQTLRPERDIMKQTGSADGWFADWLCKKFDWFVSRPYYMSDCHGSCSDTDNGNREYLDFTFPYLLEVKNIKLQGIREIITGGHKSDKNASGGSDVNIPPIASD